MNYETNLQNYLDNALAEEHAHDNKIGITCFKSTIGVETGRAYHKVYRSNDQPGAQRSVHSFVHIQSGDVYSAKSWKQKGRLIGNINN